MPKERNCADKKSKWRVHYPMRQIFANDRKVRFNIDRTILFSQGEKYLREFLIEACYTTPRYIAVRSTYLYSDLQPFPRRRLRYKGRVRSGIKRVFRICGGKALRPASIARSLLEVVRGPEGGQVVLKDKKDQVWLREVQARYEAKNFSSGLDTYLNGDESSICSDSEEMRA